MFGAAIIVNKMPADYRFANACESEKWNDLVDAIQVRTEASSHLRHDETDIAVPVSQPHFHWTLDCDCEDF